LEKQVNIQLICIDAQQMTAQRFPAQPHDSEANDAQQMTAQRFPAQPHDSEANDAQQMTAQRFPAQPNDAKLMTRSQ